MPCFQSGIRLLYHQLHLLALKCKVLHLFRWKLEFLAGSVVDKAKILGKILFGAPGFRAAHHTCLIQICRGYFRNASAGANANPSLHFACQTKKWNVFFFFPTVLIAVRNDQKATGILLLKITKVYPFPPAPLVNSRWWWRVYSSD